MGYDEDPTRHTKRVRAFAREVYTAEDRIPSFGFLCNKMYEQRTLQTQPNSMGAN